MQGEETNKELGLFMNACRFYKEHSDSLSIMDWNNLPWWFKALADMMELQMKWQEHYPLMNELLAAVFGCLEYIDGDKKEEEEGFVQE